MKKKINPNCTTLELQSMGSHPYFHIVLAFILLSPLLSSARREPRELFLVKPEPLVLDYHNGSLLTGNYTVNILWYGNFTAAQRAIVVDFIQSLSATSIPAPSVFSWWNTTSLYRGGGARLTLGRQYLNTGLTLGNSLSLTDLLRLANSSGPHRSSITFVFTSPSVLVDGFCVSACGAHKHTPAGRHNKTRYTYLWIGNSESQCPGECAWPFHKPIYGPQNDPLIPPNGDVGMDGLIINLATLLAGTVTNPYDDGYFQGDKEEPLEAVSACPGTFGNGSYPGYAGQLLIDPTTGASYNAVGLNGRKYLIPAMWNPITQECTPLV